jgi:molybdopterin-containing oxidoreductase family iron-sulfur binding subunit
MDTPYGTFPNLEMQFLTLACQHCEAPPCVDACPAEATFVREDGIVMQNYDDCLGCQACILACPYSKVRTYNEEKPHYYSEYPLGDDGVALQQKGTVSKCTLCHHRIDQGLEPNCIEVCPAKARYFGNAGDAESEVAQLLKEREYIRFLEEKGTEPSIYYLV